MTLSVLETGVLPNWQSLQIYFDVNTLGHKNQDERLLCVYRGKPVLKIDREVGNFAR